MSDEDYVVDFSYDVLQNERNSLTITKQTMVTRSYRKTMGSLKGIMQTFSSRNHIRITPRRTWTNVERRRQEESCDSSFLSTSFSVEDTMTKKDKSTRKPLLCESSESGHQAHKSPKPPAIPINKKRQVTFSDQTSSCFTIHRQDFSSDECRAVWYTKDEYEEITLDCCKQIHKLDLGKRLQDKKDCARGLESNTRIASIAKAMNRSLAHHVVFEEQDRQCLRSSRDEDHLAYLYHSASSSCQIWANVVGMTDQRAAEDTHDEDDSKETATSYCHSKDNISHTSPPSQRWARRIDFAKLASWQTRHTLGGDVHPSGLGFVISFGLESNRYLR